jgi:hypothetical protein
MHRATPRRSNSMVMVVAGAAVALLMGVAGAFFALRSPPRPSRRAVAPTPSAPPVVTAPARPAAR